MQAKTWFWLKKTFGKEKRNEFSDGPAEQTVLSALGLDLGASAVASIYRSEKDDLPSVQVHSVRYAQRPRQDGGTIRDVVVEVVQRRRGYLDAEVQREVDSLKTRLDGAIEDKNPKYRPDFIFRGGCTLLIDGETGSVRYVIIKDILSEDRLNRRRKYESGDAAEELGMTYYRLPEAPTREPFAMLHRGF